jgi:hypothetical protein
MRAILWAAWFGQVDLMKVLVNNEADVRCSSKVSDLFNDAAVAHSWRERMHRQTIAQRCRS